VGIIPAILTLSNSQSKTRQKQISRRTIALAITWLSLYILLFIGSDTTSGILAFQLLYANALITTGYFITCLILILRSKPQNSLKINSLRKNNDKIVNKNRS
jgi:preprotein translocase subunit SecG